LNGLRISAVTEPLPDGVSLRPPTLDDVSAILAVVHASDIAAVGEADFTADDVVEILTAPNHDPAYDSWVAVDASDRIIGWAYIDNPLNSPRDLFDAYIHPEHGRGLHPALLQRVMARIAERARDAGAPARTARGAAVASDEAYLALLRSLGFSFVKRYARMRRELAADEPAPALPPGVVIRPVRPDDEPELRAFHEVLDVAFRDTPDYQASTYEQFRQRLAALPGIEWDEWFVAEILPASAPHASAEGAGQIAAILQSDGDEPAEGWVKNLAVRADHRGRGLGRLLLLTAFHTYAGKGRRAAGLGVDMTNPTGAYRLYESVGMYPVYESDVYERQIPAAPRP
jgi:mycothiol synthase